MFSYLIKKQRRRAEERRRHEEMLKGLEICIKVTHDQIENPQARIC